MVVTMIAMGMVQAALDQIINVVAMRQGGVAAIWTMDMALGMAGKLLLGGAAVWVLGVHLEDMLLKALAFLILQMAGCQVISVPVMAHGDMSATGTVLVL